MRLKQTLLCKSDMVSYMMLMHVVLSLHLFHCGGAKWNVHSYLEIEFELRLLPYSMQFHFKNSYHFESIVKFTFQPVGSSNSCLIHFDIT